MEQGRKEITRRLPAGYITLDPGVTIRSIEPQLRAFGCSLRNPVFPSGLHKTENSLIAVIAKMKGVSPDELAEQMAGQMIPSQTGALANPR